MDRDPLVSPIKNEKNEKKQVIPNLYPPVGHPHRWHPAAGPLVAAPCSLSAGQEWGRGGDPPKMGQGEEIRWRWTRGGDPPEMGQGEDSRRPAGVLGGGGAVASHRKKKTAPAFLIRLTSGPLSKSAQIEFSLPAQHLQVGP
jgi:hypothetical protein